MMLVKTLTLAAVAAIVVMAFVGVSSAAAAEHEQIVLCEKAELVCEPNNLYPNPTEIHLEAKDLKLLTSLGTVDCEKSLAIVTLLNKLAALVEGHLLALTFEGCKRLKLFGASEACTITANEISGFSLTPGVTKLLALAKSIEREGKNTNATVKCGEVINCTFAASAETVLTVHTDASGHLLLIANDTPLGSTGGGFCPEILLLDATYQAVNLDAELTLKTGLWLEL